MNERHRQIFNRLVAMSDSQRVLIKANPFPYLHKLQDENAKLRSAIDEAYAVLTGVDDFTYASELAPGMEPSLVETCIKKNSEAAKVLRDALR